MINRREFLVGSLALAGQHKLLLSFSPGGHDPALAGPPHNLLSTTFPEAFLHSHLAAPGQWHPYPKWNERAAWAAVPTDIKSAFIAQAEADQRSGWSALLATTFLEYKRNGNRSHYEDESFGRRAKLLHLVLAECMEGKGRFLDPITNGVWLICEESFWGVPAHLSAQIAGVGLPDTTEPIVELFGAETAQILAWTKYLVGEQLDHISPLIVPRIKEETERRILGPARTRDDFWWMGLKPDNHNSRLNNWTPWINSNLMVANLILEDDPQRRLVETTRILGSLDQYLNQYWPDAGEEEGPGYFSESPMCYFDAVSMIQSATGDLTQVFATPFIRDMGRYILAAHIAGDDYVDFGDAHVHAAPDGGLLYRFGKAVRDAQLREFGAYCATNHGWSATGANLAEELRKRLISMSRALPAILDAEEVRHAKRRDVLLRDAYYPDLGLVTARVKADSSEGMYFADLAANNGRSHSHNDTGSYILYLDGKPVAIDVGVEAYTAKTFGPDRYAIWTMQSAFHNLPTINGVMQQNGVAFKATDRKYQTNDQRAMYSFNIRDAYPAAAGVKSWVRTVTLDRVKDVVTVQERFELENPAPIVFSIMTQRLALTGPGGTLRLKLLSGEGRDCLLQYDPTQLEPKIETIPLTDAGLRSIWGEQIYRILLSSKERVARSTWCYGFRPA